MGVRASRDARLALEAMNQLGYGLHALGKWDEATEAWGQGLERARQSVDQGNVATYLNNLGIMAQQQGDLPEAERLYNENLVIMRRLGYERGIAQALHNLGILAQNRGHIPEAERLYTESLGTKRRLGRQEGIAISLGTIGLILEGGKLREVPASLQEAMEIFRRLGSPTADQAERELARVRDRLG